MAAWALDLHHGPLQVNLGAYFYELQKPRAALGCFEAAADADDDGRHAVVAQDNARVLPLSLPVVLSLCVARQRAWVVTAVACGNRTS